MELLMLIIAVLIAAAAVFFTAYFLLKQFLLNEEKKRLLELKMKNQQMITPIRLQAYERLVLFLERISPNSMVIRVYQPSMNAFQLQTSLIKAIRDEFEHNLSQQIYVTDNAWALIRNAKEETVKLVNIAASRVGDQANATDLSTAILEISMQNPVQKNYQAIEFLKSEIHQLF
jgi:hypothetical protein